MRKGPIPAETERSIRKSRLRLRVLLMLSSLGEAYLGQLADACGIRPAVVAWLLFGRLPYYAPALSLVALGLVEVRDTPRGRLFVITAKGRRKARSLTARRVRAVAKLREPLS